MRQELCIFIRWTEGASWESRISNSESRDVTEYSRQRDRNEPRCSQGMVESGAIRRVGAPSSCGRFRLPYD